VAEVGAAITTCLERTTALNLVIRRQADSVDVAEAGRPAQFTIHRGEPDPALSGSQHWQERERSPRVILTFRELPVEARRPVLLCFDRVHPAPPADPAPVPPATPMLDAWTPRCPRTGSSGRTYAHPWRPSATAPLGDAQRHPPRREGYGA
jgi:hypothetical protein